MLRILLVLAVATLAPAAHAKDFPTRPIKLILTNPPGGTVGILARVIGEGLTKRLGQPVIIEPKPGANGNTAADAVIRSDPDGYTLLVAPAGPYTTNKLIFSSTSYDPQRAFAPVSIVAVAPLVLVVHPSMPIKSLEELLAYARANPGKLSYSAQGFGATGHLAMELLKSMTGIDVVHITYQGSAPALVDLLAGRVALAFDNTTTVMPHIQAGTLRAIAVAEPQRLKALPDIPTVSEAGVPGFVASPWFGIAAPAGTPAAIVAELSEAIRAHVTDETLKARFAEQGVELRGSTPAEFSAHLESETKRWAEILRKSGIQPR
jgi:tripartite-type tricarboxylate transporter receptor subunit TctC